MLFDKYNKVAIHPLKNLLIFLVFTEVLFFIGPIDYKISNPRLLIFYFAILNLSLYLGYVKAISRYRPSTFYLNLSTIKFLLLLGFILQIEYMIRKWANHGLSISLQSLLFALLNPGNVYQGEADVNVNFITGVILTPFRWAAIPLGIYSWGKLDKLYRFIVIATGVVYVLTWLGIGTRKGLMDLILMIYFLIVASNSNLLYDSAKRNKLKVIAIGMIAVFLFFFLFSNISRAGMTNLSDLEDMMSKEYHPFYIKHCSPILLSALSEITSYLCQGYNALSISLTDIGIIPITFGGSSMATWLYMNRFFGYNPIPNTYMAILDNEYGIDKYQNWHSMYLWLANDFTFIGVPIIIYIIGYCFGIIWIDSISKKNPFSYPMCAFMIIMVFYFFANNQVLSFSFEAFILSTAIYLYTRLNQSYGK